jgi:putative transposase
MNNSTLINDTFYHIYNRSIHGYNLFTDSRDYERFMLLITKFINPIADIYAWVFMPKHFHLLVRIRDKMVYKYSKEVCDQIGLDFNEVKWQTIEAPELSENQNFSTTPKSHLHFSHLFNAYSKYYNKRHNRYGTLFQRPFKRKQVDNPEYLKNIILYIHNNPVHHRFCNHTAEYPWSSYLTSLSISQTHLKRDAVIGWFDNQANFKSSHDVKIDVKDIDKWLDLD